MKSIQKLVRAAADRQSRMTVGNHSMRRYENNVCFTYHGNTVCKWNLITNEFTLDDCGYKGYSSTTRTLNDYRKELTTYQAIQKEG